MHLNLKVMWLFVYGFEDLWFLFLVFPFFAHINVKESDNFLDFKFVNGSILMNLFLSLFSRILIFSIFGSTYRSDYKIDNLSIYIDFVKELCRIPCHGNLYIKSKSEFDIFQLPTSRSRWNTSIDMGRFRDQNMIIFYLVSVFWIYD